MNNDMDKRGIEQRSSEKNMIIVQVLYFVVYSIIAVYEIFFKSVLLLSALLSIL